MTDDRVLVIASDLDASVRYRIRTLEDLKDYLEEVMGQAKTTATTCFKALVRDGEEVLSYQATYSPSEKADKLYHLSVDVKSDPNGLTGAIELYLGQDGHHLYPTKHLAFKHAFPGVTDPRNTIDDSLGPWDGSSCYLTCQDEHCEGRLCYWDKEPLEIPVSVYLQSEHDKRCSVRTLATEASERLMARYREERRCPYCGKHLVVINPAKD
ncbi:MAG: hypothetical protein ACM3ZQ_11765 [Bacillota bacterium]